MSNLLKSEFLSSLKADLLDRRLLPIVALVCVGLVAAIGYAVLAGGSSATPTPAPSPAVASVATPTGGVTATQTQTSTTQAVAETTNGATRQHAGKARDPFNPLPGAGKAAAASSSSAASTPASSKSSSSSSSSSSGSSSAKTPATGGSSTPAKTPSKAKTGKPKKLYDVSVLFGVLPAGTAPAGAQLQAYEKIKLQTPLPEATPLVIYRGVTAGGKSATFTVYGEVILHGQANCLPSTSQCQAIDLKPGESEQLEYLPVGATEVVIYELRVVSIAEASASTASLKNSLRGESLKGRKLLRDAGLVSLPGMHYGTEVGVLVFDGHNGFARQSRYRAHAAVQGAHHGA